MTRRAALRDQRGYYGIGIEHWKNAVNIGTLWRTAQTFGAAFIFTIGRRYQQQASDTMKSWRRVPLLTYATFEDFHEHIPYDCQLVGIELDPKATALESFTHPQRCIYLLGAEDHGLSAEARRRCHRLVVLPGEYCLNVSVAGSIALYHRHVQRRAIEVAA